MNFFIDPSIPNRPLVFAHRGASEEYPQNTLLAFEMALKQGAVGLETDLQYTKDHQVICFHDPYLDRLSTLHGKVSSITRKELAATHVKHKIYGGQPIPTLMDLLDWLPQTALLFLELKDDNFQNRENIEGLLNLLAKYDCLSRVILSSFSLANLTQAKQVLPTMPTCFITPYNPLTNISVDVLAPLFSILWLFPSYIHRAHKTNKLVSVWDPHPEKRIQYYIKQKVDIVTGDNPEKIKSAISLANNEEL